MKGINHVSKRVFVRAFLFTLYFFISVTLSAQEIKKGEVLISFSVRQGFYQAVINRKEWRTPQTITLCKEDELSFSIFGSSHYYGDEAKKLYALVFKPIESLLKKGDRLFFTPAGQLFFINLSALTNESGVTLGDIYHFHRLSSLKEYSQSKEELPSYTDWLLFGGMDYLADPDLMFSSVRILHIHNMEYLFKDLVPSESKDKLYFGMAEDGSRAGYDNLPHSRDEIKDLWDLRRRFGIRYYTGYKACEEQFRFEVRRTNPYVVLLSTHGFTYGDYSNNESACGLLFSGAGHTIEGRKLPYGLNDGILYAQEIEKLDMKGATLVVLAACNTGLGIVTQDGIKGLQSAFKKAGAETLVLTLWSVNDRATAAFSKHLFTYLEKGKEKHEAFELAIRDLKRSQYFHDPVYWAPFIMLD